MKWKFWKDRVRTTVARMKYLKMKSILINIIYILLIGCKPSPTYNAFDDKFDISIRDVINDGCDTVSVGCGYFNLQQERGSLRNYYQLFGFDSEVVAKGFVYFLDTLKVKDKKSYNILRSTDIDDRRINDLNSNLKKYDYKYYRQKKSEYGSIVE